VEGEEEEDLPFFIGLMGSIAFVNFFIIIIINVNGKIKKWV